MNKAKLTIFLISILNISYVIYNKGLKPLFLNFIELIKLVFNNVLVPIIVYLYISLSNIFTYIINYNFKDSISDMKYTLEHSKEYFKQNDFESIYNDIVKIKNIIIIIIKHFHTEYKEHYDVTLIGINKEFTEIEYIKTTILEGRTVICKFDLVNNEIISEELSETNPHIYSN